MQIIRNTFLVEGDKDEAKRLSIKDSLTGEYLLIDTDFDKYQYSSQIAKVVGVPKLIEKSQGKYDTEIKEGDTILVHHFVLQDDMAVNVDEKTYYKAPYYHLFALVKDETIIPLESFLFVLPIEQEEVFVGDIQVTFDVTEKQGCGKVAFLSKQAQELGLQIGDVVFYTKNANYELNVGDTKYLRMRTRNILYCKRGDYSFCIKDHVLVQLNNKEHSWGIKSKSDEGVVIEKGEGVDGIEIGDSISFFKGIAVAVEFGEDTYLLLNKKNINIIL